MTTRPGPGLFATDAGGDALFQLDVGSVLGRTFRIWLENLVPFFLVGLAVNTPVFLGLGAIALTGSTMPLAQNLLDLVSNVLTLVLTGAVTYGVFHSLRGQRAGAREILDKGLSRLGTVWLTGLLAGLGTVLGICALVIPGLILAARWWVAVPVAVIEAPGASNALGRSTELTSGNRWRTFALVLVQGVITVGATMLLGAALGLIEGSFAEGPRGAVLMPWAQALLQVLVLPVVALGAVMPAVAYHDLRVGKEGADVEELLKVFE